MPHAIVLIFSATRHENIIIVGIMVVEWDFIGELQNRD